MDLTRKPKNNAALLKALDKSLALIEYDLKGTILSANANVCQMFGYKAEEVVGKHHSISVDADYARSAEYREFWDRLGRGESLTHEVKRIGKGGAEVWVQTAFHPVLDAKGKVRRVVNIVTDITAQNVKKAEFEAMLTAISHAQAVIEFTPAGEIITANSNFLTAMGYSLDEIKGRHHRMFVDPAYAASPEYQAFWAKLNRGEHIADMFVRIAKGGRKVQLQASYNPVFGLDRRVAKVVKFASDVSDLLDVGAALSRMAENDLEQPISKQFQPMFAAIQRDFNTAQGKLKATLLGIADSVEAVSSGAKEIATASEDLSHRTEEQAASLEETSSALDAVTDTVKKTADGSARARTVVGETRANAEKAGAVVRSAVEAMGRIEKSSQQISQIIGVIDEIAFQTNLLALNAGVEAARAGDAGKGFAVVASEVRALAQRSAEAAKEIKGLIASSTDEVSGGVRLVAETGDALTQIIEQVGQVNGLVGEIASGAEGQATSLHEVNAAVTQMDELTQQNAAMAEEASAAGTSMLQEAGRLASMIAQFKLGRTETQRALRAELKQAAPHVFAKPAAVPRAGAKAPASLKPPALVKAPARIKAAPPAPSAKTATGGGEDWNEF